MTILLLMTQGVKKFQRYLRKSVMGRPYVNIVCTCNGNVCVLVGATARASRVEGGGARRKRSGPATTTFQRSHEVCTASLVSISSSEGSS